MASGSTAGSQASSGSVTEMVGTGAGTAGAGSAGVGSVTTGAGVGSGTTTSGAGSGAVTTGGGAGSLTGGVGELSVTGGVGVGSATGGAGAGAGSVAVDAGGVGVEGADSVPPEAFGGVGVVVEVDELVPGADVLGLGDVVVDFVPEGEGDGVAATEMDDDGLPEAVDRFPLLAVVVRVDERGPWAAMSASTREGDFTATG